MSNEGCNQNTHAEKEDPKRNIGDTQTYEPVRSFDWDKIFEDVGLEEDIEKSDERGDINSSIDFRKREQDSYMQFDKEFHNFLKNFVHAQDRKENQKIWLKGIFFIVIMLGFFALIITPVIIILRSGSLSDSSIIVAMISVLIELVSAIIVLPKIIAEYLFNKEEDKNMTEIIKSMQNYNEKKHDHFK